jgi:hypothetical protein
MLVAQRYPPEMPQLIVHFASKLTDSEAHERMRMFSVAYKQDWKDWVAVAGEVRSDADVVAAAFRRVLRRWSAVRSRMKGRVVRHCRTSADADDLCLDDLIAEARPFLNELGTLSLRDVSSLTHRQERALRMLWEIFRDLPTHGSANAVGITKAVKLLTLGRIGPAFDAVVCRNIQVQAPCSADEWIAALGAISEDLRYFERRSERRLEDLVEPAWRPVAVGRAFDMLAGPSGQPVRPKLSPG